MTFVHQKEDEKKVSFSQWKIHFCVRPDLICKTTVRHNTSVDWHLMMCSYRHSCGFTSYLFVQPSSQCVFKIPFPNIPVFSRWIRGEKNPKSNRLRKWGPFWGLFTQSHFVTWLHLSLRSPRPSNRLWGSRVGAVQTKRVAGGGLKQTKRDNSKPN